MSRTCGKIHGSVAQSFYVPQRGDMHYLNVLPFLLKEPQLFGN